MEYAETPLILQLTKQSEVFLEAGHRIIPLNIFNPGDLYGLFEAIKPFTHCPIYPIWHVTSGVRSAFMLPSITDCVFHKRLVDRFDLPPSPPPSLHQHWEIFKAITTASQGESPWEAEVLVFPKSWFKEKTSSLEWVNFQNYLLKQAWRQAQITRNRYEVSVVWEYFAPTIKEIKPNSYILATLQHLINLSFGVVPGFKPMNGHSDALPIELIQKAYLEVYQLKHYYPTIMVPHLLTRCAPGEAIYYSMAYPTLLEGSPFTRKRRTIIDELRLTKRLLNAFMNSLHNAPREELFSHLWCTHYEFLHPLAELDGNEDMEIILSQDPNINPSNFLKGENKTFSPNSPFLKGCVQVTKTK